MAGRQCVLGRTLVWKIGSHVYRLFLVPSDWSMEFDRKGTGSTWMAGSSTKHGGKIEEEISLPSVFLLSRRKSSISKSDSHPRRHLY